MRIGLERSTEGSDKNKILLDHVLFWRRRRLWEILQRCILVAPFLRLSSLFKGGVVRPKLEAVSVGYTSRGLIIRRPECYKEAKSNAALQENIRDQ
jgi:hypothetical protein